MDKKEILDILDNAKDDRGAVPMRLVRQALDKLSAIQPISSVQPKPDCVSRKTALDAFGLSEKTRKYGGDHSGYDTRMLYEIQDTLENLPAVQPDHIADIGKKVSISCGHENDVISREAAIEALARMMPRSYTPDGSHPADEEIFRAQEVFADCIEALEILPPAQPEIIRCKDCEHRHVENMVWTCPFGLSGGENFFCGYGTEPYKGE